MANPMMPTLDNQGTRQRSRWIVELVGPAGAGKTTVALGLCQRNLQIRLGLQLSKPRLAPFYANTILELLPTYLSHRKNERWLTREELRAMVYLEAWHHVLSRSMPNTGAVTVLDHGPVFRLAWLHEFGPEIVQSRRVEAWSDDMLGWWAAALNLIVWLDAPDVVLLERIQTRKRWHLVKGRSEQEAREFLVRCRSSLEQVMATLTANHGPTVLRFQTQQETPDQIVERVLAALGLQSSKERTGI